MEKLSFKFSVLYCGLLLLVASSSIYFVFIIQPTGTDFHQWLTANHWMMDTVTETENNKTLALEAQVKVLLKEKLTLQEKVNRYEKEQKSLHHVVDQTKNDFQRQLSEMLTENKAKEQHQSETLIKLGNEIEILEANATIHRNLFDFVSNVSRNTSYRGVEFYTRYTVARLGMMPLSGIEPLRPDFGSVVNDVLSFQYPLTIPPCQDVGANYSVFLAIISAPGNFVKRNLTRQTWPKHLKNEQDKGRMGIAGFAFILGKPDKNETQKQIEEESEMYRDIIQIEMMDTYRNLSLKVAGLFNWLHSRNCSNVDFLFKVDDDVYVNVRNLVQFVQSRAHHDTDLKIFGNSAGNLWPARDGKWGLTYEEWPWRDFPRYFFGPGVLFPGNTIVALLASFQTTPMVHIDDLYYSGICVERAGINISYSTNSTSVMRMGLPNVPAACDLRLSISWLTVSSSHMNNSHWATEDFYNNRTQCVITGANNGTNTTIDYTEAVEFYFV